MLVLTLKPGEEIVIGDEEIIIRSTDRNDRPVALGFEARGDVPINRREIFMRKKAEGAIPAVLKSSK